LPARAEVVLTEVAHWGVEPDAVVGQALNVVVSGHYAYVADGAGGLQILDVSNPAAPILAGSLDTGGFARGLAVAGGRAYLTDFYNGFLVVDVSNPSAPVRMGSVAAYGDKIAVVGHYAYVAGYGLSIIDISNPSEPVITRRIDIGGWFYDIAVVGDYAYMLTASADDVPLIPGGLWIVDVSDPIVPKPLGRVLSDASVAVPGANTYLTLWHVIIDISNPILPALVGRLDLGGKVARDIVVSAGYAYATVDGDGLRVFDISDPASPRLAGGFSTTAWPSESLAVSDGYIYAANGGDQLRIFSAVPTNAQCADYNPAAVPQVRIPCVQLNGTAYQTGLNPLPGAGLRFALDWARTTPVNLTPGPDCAVFSAGLSGNLRLNCLQAGGNSYWAEMSLTPEAVFALGDFGAR
jgi:hypothetical protein